MNKKGKEMAEAIEKEVESWPGVTVSFSEGGTHPKAKFAFNGIMLSRPFAGTTGDSAFGVHQMLGDMRRVMKQLGAARDKPEPSKEEDEAPYRKPNNGAAARKDPPKLDPAVPQPDIGDQLAAQGLVTDEQRRAVQAEGSAETYRKRELIVMADDGETEDEAEREARLEELQAQIDAIQDGVYFGLAPEVYHAVPALGSGSLCDLDISPATFWRGSWLDPNRPELDEEQTAAQLLGKAYHTARLEPEKFERLFCRQISKADFPRKGMLTSDTAVKAALKAQGEQQTVSGETPEERAERLEDLGYPGTIWPLELARWERDIAALDPRPTPIAAKLWDDLVIDMERIRKVPDIADLLTGGEAEVSVFWTDEHGLRCKARFDYLKPDSWSDLKTFANPNGKKLAQAVKDAFQYNRYYMQGAHYRDGAEAIRTGGLQIVGEATDAQRELVAKIQIAPQTLACWYIFQEKGGVPNLLAKRYRFSALGVQREHELRAMLGENPTPAQRIMIEESLGQVTGIYKIARMRIRRAKETFLEYSAVYEPGEPWGLFDPMSEFDDDEFSPGFLEGKY